MFAFSLSLALHYAAWMGHSSIVKMLYFAGADPHAKNSFGLTPVNLTHPKVHDFFSLSFLFFFLSYLPICSLVIWHLADNPD